MATGGSRSRGGVPAASVAAAILSLATACAVPTPVMLNEWSAVEETRYLRNGGTDERLGRVLGNGGPWLELVVTLDHADLRGLKLEWATAKARGTLTLTQAQLWSDVRAGTLITFGSRRTDLSFDPAAGDQLLHVALHDTSLVTGPAGAPAELLPKGGGLTFRVVGDPEEEPVFGPVGDLVEGYEGPSLPADGAWRLESDPAALPEEPLRYAPAFETTYGLENRFGGRAQDLSALRAWAHASREGPASPLRLSARADVELPCRGDALAHSARAGALLVIDREARALWALSPPNLEEPEATLLDLDPAAPGPGPLALPRSPGGLAAHPRLPLALLTLPDASPAQRGRLLALDLTPATRGDLALDQAAGPVPGAVIGQPTGRYALVACTGAGSGETPGSLHFFDLEELTPDRDPDMARPLAAWPLPGLETLLQLPLGSIEPTALCFAPDGRLAAAAVPTAHAAVLVDLRGPPRLAGRVPLALDAMPVDLALIEAAPAPDGSPRLLLAVAEAGRRGPDGPQGQAVSLHMVDPAAPDGGGRLLSRLDLRRLAGGAPTDARTPTGLTMVQVGERIAVVVVVRETGTILLIDATEPASPRLADRHELRAVARSLLLYEEGGVRRLAVATGSDDAAHGRLAIVEIE